MDVNRSLNHAVSQGRLERVRELINSSGVSYSKAWAGGGGYVLLRSAVKSNHAAVAKLLLESDAKVNSKSEKPTDTPLHFAVYNGDIEIVKMLLDKGANIHAKNQCGRTPLSNAIGNKKKIQVIELLLKNGADANSRDNDGKSLLHAAAEIGCLQTVEHLLKYGAYVNCVCTSKWRKSYVPLHFAVEKGYQEVVTLLLNRGANADVKGEDGITPLHIAAQNGYIHIAEDLLNHGACTHSFTLKEGYTPLHFASELGSEEAVKLFLNKGADINARTNDSLTPLHIATKTGRKTVVKLLLQSGAKVDNQDKDGKTTLHLAVEKGYSTMVEDVLKYCPDINDQSNRSSLKIAVHGYGEEYKKIVEALLEYGLIVNTEDANSPKLLHAAVEKGYLKIVEDLLKYGADVNALYSTYKEGFTPLHMAAKNRQEEVAKLLISYEADINAQDETGKTPISYAIEKADFKITKLLLTNRANIKDSPDLLNIAVKKECIEIVEALLQHDADINASDECGRTALHFTSLSVRDDFGYLTNEDINIKIVEALLRHDDYINARNKYGIWNRERDDFGFFTNEDINIKGEIAKLLLSKGANVDAQTKNGVTSLHAAVQKGYANVVEALLKCNANVNSGVKNGTTLLHLAALIGNAEISTMLLNKGVNVNAKQKDGITALHIATQKGHKEVVKVLLECGAKVDSKIKRDITPLHLSAQEGYQEIIETILKFGANIESRDEYGRTALHIASQEGHDEVVVTLLEYGSDINITSRNNHTPLDYAIAGISRQINSYSFDDDDYYDPDRFICPCEVTAIILKKQIVKVEAAGLYVSERNLLLLGSDDGIRGYNEISHFQNECEAEVEIMKGEKIVNSNASFHDILTKSISRLAIYAGNENIVHALKSDDYKIKFPIYASMIDRQFRRGVERKELLEQGNKSFNSLFESAPELPYQCTEKIFSYLSDEDLRILMYACKPLSISYPNTNINDVVITSNLSQVQYVSVKEE